MGGGEKEQGERGSAALGVQGEEVVEEKGERNEGGGDDMGVDLCGVFEAFGSGSGVEEVVQMSGFVLCESRCAIVFFSVSSPTTTSFSYSATAMDLHLSLARGLMIQKIFTT
ncbi:hypothetical protein V6N13_031865 [Hibiscus sabdariffa]